MSILHLVVAAAISLQAAPRSPVAFEPWGASGPRPVNAIEFLPGGDRLILTLMPARVAEWEGRAADADAPEVTLFESRLNGGVWTRPQRLPFTGAHSDYEASFSPDGTFAVFNSQRPAPDGTPAAPRKNNLWLVRRLPNGWSEPRYLAALNRPATEESYGAIGPGNRLIFVKEGAADEHGPDYDLHLSQLSPEGDASPSTPFAPAATRFGEGDPWFARDGSYVIFTRWDRSRPWAETVDLYITFEGDGRWSDPVPLEDLNGPGTADYAVSIAHVPERVYWKRGGRTLEQPWGPILQRACSRARTTP
jgi:hypothetical protein